MRRVATNPEGSLTRNREEARPGLRSFHLRHAHRTDAAERVRYPVHVLYYCVVAAGLIEIVRVLHERMEPSPHLREEDRSSRYLPPISFSSYAKRM